MTMKDIELVIRELNSVAEFKQAECLQRAVWGDDDIPDNADILQAVKHAGGLVAGAFSHDRILGFLFGFPSSDPHRQHSHRLGVHPDSRGMGLGVRLKWFQRDWCLSRNIQTVCWTYDPMLSINAMLNIQKLGATSNTYYEDYYGEMEGINAGAPSDRLLAEWQLDSNEVTQRAGDGLLDATAMDTETCVFVVIPADFTVMLIDEPTKALSERLRVRSDMQQAFSRGYTIVGFDKLTLRYTLLLSRTPVIPVDS